MSKFCPIVGRRDNSPLLDCSNRCVFYNEDGCIIQQALAVYLKSYEPLKMKTKLTQEDIVRAMEILRRPSEPVIFKHPELNIRHDYDEYGIDWYPAGPNDIAP